MIATILPLFCRLSPYSTTCTTYLGTFSMPLASPQVLPGAPCPFAFFRCCQVAMHLCMHNSMLLMDRKPPLHSVISHPNVCWWVVPLLHTLGPLIIVHTCQAWAMHHASANQLTCFACFPSLGLHASANLPTCVCPPWACMHAHVCFARAFHQVVTGPHDHAHKSCAWPCSFTTHAPSCPHPTLS